MKMLTQTHVGVNKSNHKIRVVVALDSFKGCASASETTSWISSGLRLGLPQGHVVYEDPVCDGGSGFGSIVSAGGTALSRLKVVARSAGSHQCVNCQFAIMEQNCRMLAIIESASVIGLATLSERVRDNVGVLHRSSYGLGELLMKAARGGAQEILLGMGDSAVQDCGVGLLAALGVEFILADGRKVSGPSVTPESIKRVKDINFSQMVSLPPIRMACNLSSVLSGSSATVANYARQKGASDVEVKALQRWTQKIDEIYSRHAGFPVGIHPGSGSSGGVGAALIAYCGAVPEYSFLTVDRMLGLREKIAGADVVIVGEGCLDAGTVKGKAPGAVAMMAAMNGIPVVAVGGSVAPKVFGSLTCAGISSVHTLSTPSQRLADYTDPAKARVLLREAGVRIADEVALLASCSGRRQNGLTRKSRKIMKPPVVLDLWQTVITRGWKYNFVETLARALRDAGLTADHSAIQQCLSVSMLRHRTEPDQFIEALVGFVETNSDTRASATRRVKEIVDRVSRDQVEQSTWIDGAKDFLQALREQRIPIVAISNSTQQVQATFEKLGIFDAFDEVILSFEQGITKPNPAIFLRSACVRQAVDQNLGGVIIGDQFEKDILPAQLLGFNAILLKHRKKPRPALWTRCLPRIGLASTFEDVTTLMNSKSNLP